MQTAFDNMDDGVALLDKDAVQFISQKRNTSRDLPSRWSIRARRSATLSFQAERGDFGPSRTARRSSAKSRRPGADVDAGRHPLRRQERRPLHRIQLQADQRRRHPRGIPRHHRVASTRGSAGGGEGGRRTHAPGHADGVRQHERRRGGDRQGHAAAIHEPSAHQFAPVAAGTGAARRSCPRRHAVSGAARDYGPSTARRTSSAMSRRRWRA